MIHQGKWRPIETAPRTSGYIGILLPYEGEIRNIPESCTSAGWYDPTPWAFADEGAWRYEEEVEAAYLQPEVWMPLVSIYCSNAE